MKRKHFSQFLGYRLKGVSGEIHVNEKDRNLRQFRKMSCYIMQDDQLLEQLTVHEGERDPLICHPIMSLIIPTVTLS